MTNYGSSYIDPKTLSGMPFRFLGKNVLLHERVVLVNIENISIGDNTRIDADVTITASEPVSFGANNHIGAQCYFAGAGGIELLDFVGISQGVRFYSGNEDYSGKYMTGPTVPAKYRGLNVGKILLGKHVVVGAGSVVLPGVEIGEASCVGALSLVKRSLEAWSIYAGVPARCVGERKRDLLDLERAYLAERD
jgi:acetyltransferase-like isoleucine patch superfamily enzyme